MDSNTSRPIPRPNTGSAMCNFLANASTKLVPLERRFDPWVRPAFDALLRDAVARGITALINRQRTNERLKLAEERPLPDEEQFLDSIITSFQRQMSGLWKPGGYERGGNTKTHGIVRAEFIVQKRLQHRGIPMIVVPVRIDMRAGRALRTPQCVPQPASRSEQTTALSAE